MDNESCSGKSLQHIVTQSQKRNDLVRLQNNLSAWCSSKYYEVLTFYSKIFSKNNWMIIWFDLQATVVKSKLCEICSCLLISFDELICVTKTKFFCWENFSCHNKQAALKAFIGDAFNLLLSVKISKEASLTRYFGTIETCQSFQVTLRSRFDERLTLEMWASLGLHFGNLILVNLSDVKS